MGIYRFVICVDVEGKDLDDAYEEMQRHMSRAPRSMEWESTDEIYDPDGAEFTPEAASAMRVRSYDKRTKSEEA